MVAIAIPSYKHYLTGATADFGYINETWDNWGRAGLITNYAPQVRLSLKRIDCAGLGLHGAGWGIRAYDCIDWHIENSRFRDILGLVPAGDRFAGEHGTYCNVAGNMTWLDCTYKNISAQAIQTVFIGRQNESSNYTKFLTAGGTIHVEGVNATDCGLANPNHTQNGRAGFPFSFFPSSQDVVVVDSSITNVGGNWWSMNPASSTAARHRSYGGILLSGHPVAILDTVNVILDTPDRELVQATNLQELHISSSHFEARGGTAAIKLTNVKTAMIAPCSGNADIYVRANTTAKYVKVGPASKGYSY